MPTPSDLSSEKVTLADAASRLRQMLDSHAVAEVSRTRLARHSSEVMTEMLENQEFLRVRIGTRRMMVVDEQYLECSRELLEAVESRLDELDPSLAELRDRFDRLTEQLNDPATQQATHDALFGNQAPTGLRKHYAPGQTEEPA